MQKNNGNRVYHKFGPVIYPDSNILILGSFPSVKSRDAEFYYMYPQNRFWKILSRIYNNDFENTNIEIKKKLLKKHKIAIYDVIEGCEIEGSKDSSISNVAPADISRLIENTNIKRIFLNGKKAFELFEKYNTKINVLYEYLPSTSPANAIYRLDKLYEYWKIIKKHQ